MFRKLPINLIPNITQSIKVLFWPYLRVVQFSNLAPRGLDTAASVYAVPVAMYAVDTQN